MTRLTKLLAGMALGASLLASGNAANAQEGSVNLNVAEVERFARLALDCVHREYPNKIAHVLHSDADALPPSQLTPIFYGCYDWHSAVHGHWLLVRLMRLNPDAPIAAEARAALEQNFTSEAAAVEAAYMAGEGRASFERPYGLAWLLQLTAELRSFDDADAQRWAETLRPLEEVAVGRYLEWLPNLVYPVRSGTHNQTAFGFALALDWARQTGHGELEALLVEKTREFHLGDVNCPLAYEPSGEDFLSPCLMQADLMRRVMSQSEFSDWLAAFMPQIPDDGSADWISPGVVLDPTDGKLVHLDGFNLSRAWNLDAIAARLPEGDARIASLLAAAAEHREAGVASVSDEHYEGSHWLASFATYLVTGKALEAMLPE
ncbi:DUF2891 domain-containing protein [Glycocaulis abyssi]|uniref:DUF2891 domain-containing protein n=1 Tax=Glycocaulis abyssi TaxID=1433403 RepID=A0ABV9NBV0_9PROT